ncbi:MAG: hypothetical protein ACOC2Q_05535 [Spirochaetota bacterium]
MNRLSHRRRPGVIIALLALFVILVGGCSVREDVLLNANGSGEATLSVNLHPIMISYMNDLMTAMTGVEAEYPIFDLDQITASFAERDGVELIALERVARGTLLMEIRFGDINELFVRENAEDILRFERVGARRELSFTLNREAVQRFLEFAPEDSMTMAEFLFPPADGSVSREEYRDEMAWALEEYDDRAAVERVLDAASIDVRITPVGRIVGQDGGRIEDGAVVFSIPVLDLLTLGEDRAYSLVFAP